ncbi:MAG: hypothetical protein ACRDM2_07680 [Gaiellaceae bacterium]
MEEGDLRAFCRCQPDAQCDCMLRGVAAVGGDEILSIFDVLTFVLSGSGPWNFTLSTVGLGR